MLVSTRIACKIVSYPGQIAIRIAILVDVATRARNGRGSSPTIRSAQDSNLHSSPDEDVKLLDRMGEASVRVLGPMSHHPLRLALTFEHLCGCGLVTARKIVLGGGGATILAAGCGFLLPGRGEVRGTREPAAGTMTTCALDRWREL